MPTVHVRQVQGTARAFPHAWNSCTVSMGAAHFVVDCFLTSLKQRLMLMMVLAQTFIHATVLQLAP